MQKQYDDICKSLTDQISKLVDNANKFLEKTIDGVKPTVAGELGSKLGLPPDIAQNAIGGLITPIIDAAKAGAKIPMPEIVLPELKLPEISIPDIPEVNAPSIPNVNKPTIDIPKF